MAILLAFESYLFLRKNKKRAFVYPGLRLRGVKSAYSVKTDIPGQDCGYFESHGIGGLLPDCFLPIQGFSDFCLMTEILWLAKI